jgi:hypothetical protein
MGMERKKEIREMKEKMKSNKEGGKKREKVGK